MTPIKSIRKKCLDCLPDNRNEIRNCKNIDCFLHEYRMGRKPVKKKFTPVKAIRKYCLWCMNNNRNEVILCIDKHCPLYPFRLGKNPNIKRIITDTQKKLAGERLEKSKLTKKKS